MGAALVGVAGLGGVIATAAVTLWLGKRAQSGSPETSAASDLWDALRSELTRLQSELVSLRAELALARKEIAALTVEAAALRSELAKRPRPRPRKAT